VVVRQHRQIPPRRRSSSISPADPVVVATSMRVTFMVSVPPVSCQSSSLPPPSGSAGLGAASGFSVFVNSTR
jgi:hypothetical protein